MARCQSPSEPAASGTARLHALLDRRRDAVLAHGRFDRLFEAYREHAARWNAAPDPGAGEMMRQGLAAACLHLALKPPDEYSAWTLNLGQPRLNLFFAGDNHRFQVTGRLFVKGVKADGASRLYVEHTRPRFEPQRSTLDIQGTDLLSIFEQYYAKGVQIPTRLYDLDQDHFAIVQGLPKVDRAWLEALGPEAVRDYLAQEHESIEERSYAFHCGCSLEKIITVLRGIYQNRERELFGDQARVEAHCPRCARRYWIGQDDYWLSSEKLDRV